MMAAVPGVHVLDDFFAATRFDVNVDVWWSITFWGKEPFKQ
jgi:hypothetical protein